MTEWQPIETAPMDGTEIILGSAPGNCYSGYWETDPNHWDEIGWQTEDARQGHYGHRHAEHPTHWMPLPEPPD